MLLNNSDTHQKECGKMTASVRVNYDKFINTGLVPATDYENSVMDEILDWANLSLHPSTEISLPDLINLYWAVQFGEVQYGVIPTEAEVIQLGDEIGV